MNASTRIVYLVTTSVEDGWDEEYNRFYDEEHIPTLLKLPGYHAATRYRAIDAEPRYLTVWEIDSLDGWQSPAHEAALSTPWAQRIAPHREFQPAFYEQIFPARGFLQGSAWGEPVGALLVNRIDVAPEHEADFNAFFNQEHLAALCSVPGAIAARRFQAIRAEPKYLAMLYLTSPEAASSPAVAQATDTPWAARVRPTYQRRARGLYVPIGDRRTPDD